MLFSIRFATFLSLSLFITLFCLSSAFKCSRAQRAEKRNRRARKAWTNCLRMCLCPASNLCCCCCCCHSCKGSLGGSNPKMKKDVREIHNKVYFMALRASRLSCSLCVLLSLSLSVSFIVCVCAWPAKEIHLTFGYNSWLPCCCCCYYFYVFSLMPLRLARGINKLRARRETLLQLSPPSLFVARLRFWPWPANKDMPTHTHTQRRTWMLALIYGNLP